MLSRSRKQNYFHAINNTSNFVNHLLAMMAEKILHYCVDSRFSYDQNREPAWAIIIESSKMSGSTYTYVNICGRHEPVSKTKIQTQKRSSVNLMDAISNNNFTTKIKPSNVQLLFSIKMNEWNIKETSTILTKVKHVTFLIVGEERQKRLLWSVKRTDYTMFTIQFFHASYVYIM